MTRRVALVGNRTANAGHSGAIIDAAATRLRQRVEVIDIHAPSAAQCSAELASVIAQGVDAVFAAGGDGTVHLALQQTAGTDLPLAIIPVGTGNDAASCIGLPQHPLSAVDIQLDGLDDGVRRRIDAGRTATGRWWLTVMCSGYDSAVNERANALRWPRGPRRYDVAIALELARLAPRDMTLTLDGMEHRLPATLIAVGNMPRYGGGKLIAPQARTDDGTFDVTIVAPISRLTLARLAPTLTRGTHIKHPAVRLLRASEVHVAAAGTTAYADGERLGDLPIETQCVAGAVTVLTPPGTTG